MTGLPNKFAAALIITTLVLLPFRIAVAQAADAAEPAATAPRESRAIESITVTGERTLLSMQNEIRRMEEDAYRAFNALNSSDEMDIFCNTRARTTSHIPQRECEPVFLSNLKKENAQNMMSQLRNAFTDEGLDIQQLQNGLDLIESDKGLKNQLSHKYEELSQEILRIAEENPDYRNALVKIGKLKSEYTAARKQKFGIE